MATIGVVGAGAVGSYYGALLARAGHDVRFLFRRDLEAVRERGLDIRSKDGDFHLLAVTACATPEEIGKVDWVICALKATAIEAARGLVEPCLHEGTRIAAFMNGLGIEEHFADWFGGHRVFGGMAFVCINRGEPGVIHHLDFGRVTIGHYEDNGTETERLRALLTSGGIETVVAPNLLFARWEKLCWNVPFSGLSVAAGGVGTATILGDPELSRLAREAILDVVRAANADMEAHGYPERMDGPEMAERMFAQTATMGDYRPSMVIDYVQGAALEVDSILGAPWRRAQELGVETPILGALYGLVRAADRRNLGEVRALRPEDLFGATA